MNLDSKKRVLEDVVYHCKTTRKTTQRDSFKNLKLLVCFFCYDQHSHFE